MALFTVISDFFVEYEPLSRFYKTSELNITNVSDDSTISIRFNDENILRIPQSIWILHHATVELAIAEINSKFTSTGGLTQDQLDVIEISKTAIEVTGAFEGKPLSNGYIWEEGVGFEITNAQVNAGEFVTFNFDSTVQIAVDSPYWNDSSNYEREAPASGTTDYIGKGLFSNAYTDPIGEVFDFTFDWNPYDGSNRVGRIKLNNCEVGDKLTVRFDFNMIPQTPNTTIVPALWYNNVSPTTGDITFTFPLTATPIFFGGGTVGQTFLCRPEITAWIGSEEDILSISLPSVKADSRCIIQPLSILLTISR